MHDRSYALATGIFVTFAVLALIVIAFWMAGADTERRPYVVVAEQSISGLGEGSQVLYRGVPAGRVDRIRIDPADPARILIHISVRPEVPIHHSTYASLYQRGFTGVAQVELDDTGRHPQPMPTTAAQPAHIPLRPSMFDQIAEAGTETLSTLNQLGTNLSAFLDDENRERVRSILASVDDALRSAEQVAQALEADLPRTLDSAARSMDAVAALADRAQTSMDELDTLMEELRETAAVARRFGDDLSGRMGTAGIDRALDAVDRAAREMARLAQSLSQQPEALLRGRQRPAPGPGEE
jgi:phospholipid/cholesterol/gamma-HCH transport system substrate-binding protein